MARKDGFTVCPNLAGHGVGTMFHGPPEILHTGAFFIWDMSQTLTTWYTHIDLTCNQVFEIFLSLTSKRSNIMGIKWNKFTQNMLNFISSSLIHRRWRQTWNRKFMKSSGVWTQWVWTQLGAKPVAFDNLIGILKVFTWVLNTYKVYISKWSACMFFILYL